MLWKTLAGHCIHTTPGGAQVFDNYFFRWLKFGNKTVQTLLNNFYPQKPGLHYVTALIIAARMNPGSCCLLGLGGAGVAHALGDYAITAVESNAEVIQVARRFFKTKHLSRLKIIHQDAKDFIQQATQSYQHILVDMFGTDSFPASCYNENFFEQCRNKLTKDGILAINLANINEQKPIFEWLCRLFKGSTLIIPVKGCANIVIIAAEKPVFSSFLTSLKSYKGLKRIVWDAQWGYMAYL